MAQRQKQPLSEEEEREIAKDAIELYADSIQVATGLYGSTIYLGSLRPEKVPLIKIIMKVSPQMLKVTGLILSKHARNYEETFGKIGLPNDLLHSLGLEEEIH